MAEETKEKIMIINLRGKLTNVPRWQRSRKVVSILKEKLKKQAKVDRVRIGDRLNKKIWERGAKNPPGKIKVSVNIITSAIDKDKKASAKSEKIAKIELIESM